MHSQHTYESCLAWSLLYLSNKTPTLKKELEILNHSLTFSKKDFTIGHLEFMSKHFKEIWLFTDSQFKYEHNLTKRLKKSKNIKIYNENILNFLQKYLQIGKIRHPLIIYTDAFAFWGYKHYPHYVILLNKKNNNFLILDPWNGKTKSVSKQTILNGIKLLKNYLNISPRIILAKNQ